jgi:hypothetical protein
MPTTLNFADRFSFPQPNGISPTISAQEAASLTEAQIVAASPELVAYSEMVRRYSVLLKRRTTLEIFNVATTEADPRIALVLASARRKLDNTFLFTDLDQVKEVMYADPNIDASGLVNRTIFSDGIRRVSAALTAALLIGQLSQVPEQAEQSHKIEQQALADLDRVCLTYEFSNSGSNSTSNDDRADPNFIFSAKDIVLESGSTVKVSWYSPGLTSTWVESRLYTSSTTAWQIVAELAESINSVSLMFNEHSLIAVAELAGGTFELNDLHYLNFYPRTPTRGVVAYSLSIKVEKSVAGVKTGEAPFDWGLRWNSLSNRVLNGMIILLKDNKASSTVNQKTHQPTVLYLRNKLRYTEELSAPTTSNLKIRVQFWAAGESNPTEDFTDINIPRVIKTDPAEQTEADNLRFSQIAIALLAALTVTRNSSGLTGAIVRNDPLSSQLPIAGVELLAWTLSRFNTYVVIDILEMPSDIEIATGGLYSPHTLFSSNPKSVRAECSTISGGSLINTGTSSSIPQLITRERKNLTWQRINDENNSIQQNIWL